MKQFEGKNILVTGACGTVGAELVKQLLGCKPGEKLYEELMSPEETRRTIELEQYFSVLPAFRGIYHEIDYNYPAVINKDVTNPYVSEEESPLTVEEIKAFLKDNNLLGQPDDDTDHRYWPGDKEEKE